jgi:hypothetical protein
MKAKVILRVMMSLNALFWVAALSFPFARFFSSATMRRLSYKFADLAVLFPIMIVGVLGVMCWLFRRNIRSVRRDIAIGLCAVVLDGYLISKV